MFWDLSEDASVKLPPVSPDQPQGAGSHKEGRVSHVKEGRVSHIEPHFIMVFHIISVPLLVINHYKPMILTYIIVPKTDQCLKFQIIKKTWFHCHVAISMPWRNRRSLCMSHTFS